MIVVASIPGTLYLRRVIPEVIAARINPYQGTKRWDRILLAIFRPIVLTISVMAALAAGRFHWRHVPWWGCVVSYTLLIAGTVGLTWQSR